MKEFTTKQYLALKRLINKNFTGLTLRINKAGNLTINGHNEEFTLRIHSTYNNYIWERLNLVNNYSHPLNMINRKSGYNMKKYIFNTFDEAFNYFVKYINTYKKEYLKK